MTGAPPRTQAERLWSVASLLGSGVVLALACQPAFAAPRSVAVDCEQTHVVLQCTKRGLQALGGELCGGAVLTFSTPGQPSKVYSQTRLLGGSDLTPAGLLCVAAASRSHFIAVDYVNGGNCDQCEKVDLFTADGHRLTESAARLGIGHLDGFRFVGKPTQDQDSDH